MNSKRVVSKCALAGAIILCGVLAGCETPEERRQRTGSMLPDGPYKQYIVEYDPDKHDYTKKPRSFDRSTWELSTIKYPQLAQECLDKAKTEAGAGADEGVLMYNAYGECYLRRMPIPHRTIEDDLDDIARDLRHGGHKDSFYEQEMRENRRRALEYKLRYELRRSRPSSAKIYR